MQIGQYIASNGGVVTAEELAPYLDVETTEKTVLFELHFTLNIEIAGSLILLFHLRNLSDFLPSSIVSW